MSALGHKRTLRPFITMSALPPKADIRRVLSDVCFVPEADMPTTSVLRCLVAQQQPVG